ncbi:MAG: phenylalanine--tRNA ligase beta subunit-related protein [Prolixibacteraceae bacterium]
MKRISITDELSDRCPDIHLLCIECDVKVESCQDGLKELTDARCAEISGSVPMEEISRISAIDSARKAYRACGKDPARYRLSAEALLRRVVNGKGLYHINNVVDLLNLVSVSTGFSIGGYDADKISGTISMGFGEKHEPYDGLGRGELNIANMPVFRDKLGAFGTPTSDSERTGVRESTKRFLMVIISFEGREGLEEAGKMAIQLLTDFASASNFETDEVISKNKVAVRRE